MEIYVLLVSFFGNHLSFREERCFICFRFWDAMPSLVIAVTTVPVVALMLVTRGVARATLKVGLLSEELFRGDRLPILTFPLDQDHDGK